MSGLNDMVSEQAGVDVVNSGPWSEKVVVRGLVGHNLMLVDGLRLDVLRDYGNHAPLTDLDQIERIEIIRGPASVLYGSDAVAGVVNIITKQPLAHAARWAVQGGAGFGYASVNNQFSQNATLSGKWNQWQFITRMNHRKSDDLQTPKGALKNTAYSGYEIDTKVKTFLSNHTLTLSGHLNRTDHAGVPVNQFAAHARFLKYDRDRIIAEYAYQNNRFAQLSIKSSLYFQQEDRNFDAFLSQIPKGPNFATNLLNANRHVTTRGGYLQASVMPFAYNLVTAGLDVYQETDDTERISDAVVEGPDGQILMDPPADLTPPTPKSSREGWGVFLEDEWTPMSFLTLNSGFRMDRIRSHADGTAGTLVESNTDKEDRDFSGHIGAILRLSSWLRLTSNAGRAFKAPTLQQRFFKGTAQVGNLTGDPDLKSETSFNIDLGLKWETDRTSGEISVFRNRVNDFIVMNPIDADAGQYEYANVGLAELTGGEFQGRIQITSSIGFYINAAYVRGEDTEINQPLPQIAPLKGNAGMLYQAPNDRFWLEVSSTFVADQERTAEHELRTPGYGLLNFSTGLNLSMFMPVRTPIHLTVNGRNMLNRSYRDHLSTVTWWDAAGRDIAVGIKIKF